jgi:predicted nucleotidyltransferase
MNGEKENSHGIPESEVIPRLMAAMPGILIGKPVMLAYLYGSTADGSRLPFSDVDIALVLEPNCPLSPYERVKLELDIAAETERLGDIHEADVRSIDAAPLTVQGMVVTEGILLYSRDEEFRIQYEVHTRKLYFDFLPVVEMMRAAFFKHAQQEGLAGGKARQS